MTKKIRPLTAFQKAVADEAFLYVLRKMPPGTSIQYYEAEFYRTCALAASKGKGGNK